MQRRLGPAAGTWLVPSGDSDDLDLARRLSTYRERAPTAPQAEAAAKLAADIVRASGAALFVRLRRLLRRRR